MKRTIKRDYETYEYICTEYFTLVRLKDWKTGFDLITLVRLKNQQNEIADYSSRISSHIL